MAKEALRNPVESLVLECCVDLGVPASVEFSHLQGDRLTLLVAASRLIALVQLADSSSTVAEESVLDAISVSNILCVSLYQLRRAHARK